MLETSEPDLSIFSGKVRVRVCGLLEEDKKILLIKHQSIGSEGYLWAPPGGGVDFGLSVEKTLEKEFWEEAGLCVEVLEFLFVNEFIDEKYHAIELFFKVRRKSGEIKLGYDPELRTDSQILSEIKFMPFNDIQEMNTEVLHNIFREVKSPEKVFNLGDLISFKR